MCVYVFFGERSNNCPINSIEKISVTHPYCWERIKPIINECKRIANVHGIQVNDHEALIYGGRDFSTYLVSFDESDKMSVKSTTSKMKVNSDFCCTCTPFIKNGILYDVDSKNYVHAYNIKKKAWNSWSIGFKR